MTLRTLYLLCKKFKRKKKVGPITNTENPEVIQKLAFGGDVLTNEKAYSAQQAMGNGNTNYECLGVFVHRPEGFHRMMNFVQIICQMFYHQSADRGTLWCLRNIVNRRDVSGPKEVVQNYRSHHAFIEDLMTEHIVDKTLEHFGMNGLNKEPTRNRPHPLVVTDEEKAKWLKKEMISVCEESVKSEKLMFDDLKNQISEFDRENDMLESININGPYKCVECQKTYKKKTGLKRHLIKVHNWISTSENWDAKRTPSKQKPTSSVAHHDSLFLFMALLLKSTSEAFKHGDGEQAMRNVRFEGVFAGSVGHTKYTWNMSANIVGGLGCKIPIDNLIEIMVKTIIKS